jgi:hypothetical protein
LPDPAGSASQEKEGGRVGDEERVQENMGEMRAAMEKDGRMDGGH